MSARHESECVPEAELRELFRPRRPDPEAFRRGVERRLAEPRAPEKPSGPDPSAPERQRREFPDREENRNAKPTGPAWLRRAAALLPGDPLTGALFGSGAGKLAGAKFLPAALALPALFFGTALGAFAAGARSLRRSSEGAQPLDPAAGRVGRRKALNRDMRVGSSVQQVLQFGGLMVALACPVLGGTWAIDVVFLVLVVSMGSLAISVRGFARAGLLTRPEVARLCTGVLASVFAGCFLWMGGFHVPDSTSELGLGWSAMVVLLGALLCLASIRVTLAGVLALLAVTPFVVVVNPLGWTSTSPGSLRAQLASFELDPGDLENWSEAAALHRALAKTGHEVPDLSRVGRALEAAIDAGVAGHPRTWTSALQMGLIDAEHRARLAGFTYPSACLAGLRKGAGALRSPEYDEYLYWLLADEHTLTPETREALADRLEAGWPEEGQHGALSYALLCVRGLDLIGCPERADALRVRAHRLLTSYWVGGDTRLFGIPGGFTSDPEVFQTSFDDQTWFAVQLMARLGTPPGIDLRLLRGHLRTESRAMLFDAMPELNAWSRGALFLLENGIRLPPRTALQRLLDERLLVAALLMVVLCGLAIRLAPALDRPTGRGAQP